MKLYREFTNQNEIDSQYNAVLSVPDLKEYICHDTKASIEVRSELKCFPDVPYGPMVDETVDIFPARAPDAPIFIFIHGGYWRSLNSSDFSLIARGLVIKGITVAIINYSLCPKVSIAEITRQSRSAVAFFYKNAQQYNGDRDLIFICGHSAGGQQVGMLAATDWDKEYKLPPDVIKGGIPISGIFDLSPLYYSWLQPSLHLTHELIYNQSPLFQIPKKGPPLLVSVGEMESDEFKRQSEYFLSKWRENGLKGESCIQSGKNHFTSFRDLMDSKSQFCKAVVEFMEKYGKIELVERKVNS